MLYRALGDAVVVVHLAFILFVAVGGFLAWRWRWLVWVHIPSVLWGAAIIVIGFDCPLTPLENGLRDRGGAATYEGGFVDRYIEDVVYPDEYTPYLRVLVILLIVAAYARILRPARRSREADNEKGRLGLPPRSPTGEARVFPGQGPVTSVSWPRGGDVTPPGLNGGHGTSAHPPRHAAGLADRCRHP